MSWRLGWDVVDNVQCMGIECHEIVEGHCARKNFRVVSWFFPEEAIGGKWKKNHTFCTHL